MDLSQVPLFSALEKRMAWLTERQTVLAENVSNIDTPGYGAQDLRAPDFRRLLSESVSRTALVATQPGHLQATRSALDLASNDLVSFRSASGGKPTLEDEMMRVSQTANDYALVSTLYRANLGMVKTVLGRSP